MIRRFPVLLMILLGCVSCEEEISIPLKSVASEIVIEGRVTNLNELQVVRISKTTDYFNPSVPSKISGAEVKIRDDDGIEWAFQETDPGVYVNGSLSGESGKEYTLEVRLDGRVIEGSSVMQTVVPLDSVRVEYFPGTRFAEPGYFVIIQFTDPPEEEPNYYRVKMYRGSQPNPVIMLLDDRLTNDNQMEFFLYGGSYLPGDTAIVELQTLDYKTYQYYYTLTNVLANDQQGATATPANPTTNLSGGVLGYFGAIALVRDTLIIEPVR